MNNPEKFDTLKDFVDRCSSNIDIIVVSETWVKSGDSQMFTLNGFDGIFSCRETSHGGLAVYARSDLNVDTEEIEEDDGFHYIRLRLRLGNGPLSLHAVYRPPAFRFANFVEKLESKLSRNSKHPNSILLGDTNVPVNLSSNIVGEYLRILESRNLFVVNNEVTRPASGNILDHVVCSQSIIASTMNETICTDISDHNMIVTTLSSSANKDVQFLSKSIVIHHQLNAEFAEALQNIPSTTCANEKIKLIADKYNEIRNPSPKQSWKFLNEALGRKSKSHDNITLKIGNEVQVDPAQVSNSINDYFCNIGPQLAANIASNRDIQQYNSLRSQPSPSLFLRPATVSEVLLEISNLDSNKSPGADNITVDTLKTHHLALSDILTDIFNEIVGTGVYPDALKLARVTPIFKSGDNSDVSNYRPISTLSVLNKILEKLLVTRISEYLSRYDLISPRQYGFRKGCSTLTATTELLEDVYDDLDNRNYAGALFLDLRKAFDTIDHALLLQKLDWYGIRGHSSSKKIITTGVPQGSNLGPLMFLVFINDLPQLNLHGKVRLFADDTIISYSHSNPLQIVEWIGNDLQVLQQYFDCNLLSLNLSKTSYMLFNSGRRSIPQLPLIRIGNTIIERVRQFKYLGLLLDDTLCWSPYIEQLKRTLAPVCGAIWKISAFIPTHWLKNVYFALFHSRL
ncbi:uncharacterized protein LOC129753091 [Uranotaenia lowii]|uniref:uncharacterized protein LOC129753091 n=1 Tax=Uranotaenia lowii TaxID=190385 RepID=UPI00247A0FD3|nr:uncharacterized protein LOC129753091 [Uranotaenia lowii]